MSNIGKHSISVPENTEIKISSNSISVKGKLGELNLNFNSLIKISQKDNLITLSRSSDKRECRELHGLYRALVQNMVIGVNEGFSKELNLVGVGYTSDKKGDFLLINAGYSVGILPTTGLPIPFISYGGSHIVFTLFSIGVMINISLNNSYNDTNIYRILNNE